MSQERVGEIEKSLRVAEDELSYVQKQRQFLLDQIASLKKEKDKLLHPDIEERPIQPSVGTVTNQSCEDAKIALFRSLDDFYRQWSGTPGVNSVRVKKDVVCVEPTDSTATPTRP